ncbi:hypothetical protein AVEN_138345-1 [Araneus ventricosus]|uniref:CCHC-type domain-containing protein n=1 Tax=Araneus ventricosus TaxID=182803 RepID=A0A4Y2NK37_ARAVE|nr:hypothetical protein AVEN_138345-1 [Araneus ventricosus]
MDPVTSRLRCRVFLKQDFLIDCWFLLLNLLGLVSTSPVEVDTSKKEKLNFIERLEGERNWVSWKFDVELQIDGAKTFQLKKETVDDIATHVFKLQRIWQDLQDELKSENVQLPKSMLLNRILNTLSAEYLEFKNALESVSVNERTVASLTERLRLHENRLESMKLPHESKSVAFVAKPSENFAKNQANSVQKEKNNKIKFQYCGHPGHMKRNCYKFKNESYEKRVQIIGLLTHVLHTMFLQN